MRFWFALGLLLMQATVLAEEERKAIFILLDGIPADVLERVETPALDDIASQGGYTRAYVGGDPTGPSRSPTVSAVAYQSLLTGTWANKHNVYDNAVTAPDYSYWDIFRIAKHARPALRTAIFSTWEDNRTKLLGDGLPAAGGRKLDYIADGYEHDVKNFPHDPVSLYIRNIDRRVAREAASLISKVAPDLSWVYLQYTDDIGHAHGDGELMDLAVRFADEQVGYIWNAVTERQRRHGEEWLVIVTTDHGRDSATGRSHGGQSPRERTIWIVTSYPALNANFNAGAAIVDILPSIATYLRLTIPQDVASQLDGRSFLYP